MAKAKILYVEDEVFLAKIVSETLEGRGFDVIHEGDGDKAVELFLKEKPHVCVLDIMLPNKDGFSIADEIREKDADVPIIFLSAKSQTNDVLNGFRLGANDYIRKPFSIEELILKIEIFLKRSQKKSPEKNLYAVGKYSFDSKNLIVFNDSEKISLTQREAELLKLFLDNKNVVLKREEILKSLWGNDDYFTGRSLDVFISRLRKILADEKGIAIENQHSVGFRFSTEE